MSTTPEVYPMDKGIRERIRIAGDCWIWTGIVSRTRSVPIARYHQKSVVPRIWIASGRELPPKKNLIRSCATELCVNPDHHDLGGVYPEKFWKRVKKSDQCWEWTGKTNHFGYGYWNNQLTHRYAYTIAIGPIPDGMSVLHRCDNPPCVNPDHLWLGTIADNNADKGRKGRTRSGHDTMPDRMKAMAALPRRTIPAEIKDQIRQVYSEGGISQKRVGLMFGISQPVVSEIIRAKRKQDQSEEAA